MRHSDIIRIVVAVFFCILAFGGGSQSLQFPAESSHDASGKTGMAANGYAGSEACAGCHAGQTEAWRKSHHAHAMFDARRPGAMLGEFGGTAISANGRRARFFSEDGRYLVETDDKDGTSARYVITHSFGWTPLQQYLVTMPDGRLQVLPWAWDTRPANDGGERWFHVYGDEQIPPGDPRHWTGLQQNWNHMCAECHTTGFSKNYDAEALRFNSRWSELGVTCESCHGPAAEHVSWANGGRPATFAQKGFSHPQPKVAAFPAPRSNGEVDLCARCHSRRSPLDAKAAPGSPFPDGYRPVLLAPEMFEHDGQMKDEVFNDHSFRQSLMYAKGVTCGHCHDPHSSRLRQPGASVCAQCHEAARFSARTHTGHANGPGAPDCISCHMPVRTYMQIDRRHDHSFRVPRPDLTDRIGTPNTCQSCHADKSPAWATTAITVWHGPQRKGFQTFGIAFHDSRKGEADAREALQQLANSPFVPAIARATALSELGRWPALSTDRVMREALTDADPLVRSTAASQHDGLAADIRRQRLLPLLSDPVRLVRITAASVLADLQLGSLDAKDDAALATGLAEYENSLRSDLDRPEAWVALATLNLRRGRSNDAEAGYRRALSLDSASPVAAVNLADMLRRTGREAEAQSLLQSAISREPRSSALQYALGLSFLRQRRNSEALAAFAAAVQGDAPQARHFYAYGLALQQAGRPSEAIEMHKQGLVTHPADVELLSSLLQDALRRSNLMDARTLASRLAGVRPDDVGIRQLMQRLEGR